MQQLYARIRLVAAGVPAGFAAAAAVRAASPAGSAEFPPFFLQSLASVAFDRQVFPPSHHVPEHGVFVIVVYTVFIVFVQLVLHLIILLIIEPILIILIILPILLDILIIPLQNRLT